MKLPTSSHHCATDNIVREGALLLVTSQQASVTLVVCVCMSPALCRTFVRVSVWHGSSLFVAGSNIVAAPPCDNIVHANKLAYYILFVL